MIKLNNKTIGSAYLGSTPIAKIYKGSELVFERKSNKDNYVLIEFVDGYGYFSYTLNGVRTSIRDVPKNGTYKLDIPLDTTTLSNLFFESSIKGNIDFSNLDTSKITNMRCLIGKDGSVYVDNINFKGFDTSKVHSFQGFCHQTQVTELDVSMFDTSNAVYMGGMFSSNSNLKSLDLSSFNTSKVKAFGSMFSHCSSLRELDLSNFTADSAELKYSSGIDDDGLYVELGCTNMFNYCNSLIHIKCKQAFKDWCIENQDEIKLPTAMREGGEGIWEIVD